MMLARKASAKLLVNVLFLGACQSKPTNQTETGTNVDGDHSTTHEDDEDATTDDQPSPSNINPSTSCKEDDGVIVPTPDSHSEYREWGFDRYAEILAPNGKPIRIVAETGVTNEQIHRARNVLRWFLTDVPGSIYGSDKTDVANQMGDNSAMLMLPAGTHEEGKEPPFDAQPLYQNEMTVEGSDWYINNNWDHRDATFEEIFHLVHDAGIGTWLPGALPEYQAELKSEALAAINDGRWGIAVDPGVRDWLNELEAEDSLAQEYIASVIDSYYGYWGAFEDPGGMWGIYIAKDREEVSEKDPRGQRLLEAFLPPMVGYEARLASNFTGTFNMTFDARVPYTHKSQYLVAVTLTGANPASIAGNPENNQLRGNAADNTLDGGEGNDTVVYCRKRAAYTAERDGGTLIIDGPDGRDTLHSIEQVYFSDGMLSSDEL